MVAFIAVHGGVTNSVMRTDKLCLNAVRSSDGDIVKAIKVMEDEGKFNCGYGSNLTRCGRVECEAAFSSSEESIFGAVGGVSRIKNPILAAEALAKMQCSEKLHNHLVPPCVLVGEGAERWAEENHIEICDADSLISEEARKTWNKAKRKLNEYSSKNRMDTVGAISIDVNGICHAACSSGGILLKTSGRLGHTTQIGGAIWSEQRDARSVAVSLSGCGERIARSCFAMKLANFFFSINTSEDIITNGMLCLLETNFLNSNWLLSMKESHAFIGGIALIVDREMKFAIFICFHNTAQLDCAFAMASENSFKLHSVSAVGSFAIQIFPISYKFH